jgi:predicted dehydrogenase
MPWCCARPMALILISALRRQTPAKHLIIEKPLEVTVERGQKLLQACRSHGVHLAVIYQSRFIEDVRKMKKAVDEWA